MFLFLSVRWQIIDKLPSQNELQHINNPLASTLHAENEKIIGRYYIENRSYLEYEELNDFYKNALIATEDHRFYKHKGVDYKSILRVFFKTILLQKDASGGGSTITQQLVKNLYPRKKYKLFSTLINKFREISIAQKLEKIYSKEELLLLYSNTVSFGEQAFGLQTAAKRFFNKEPNQLLLEEAATLVGMLKATTYYSPRNYPERAEKRRNVVLQQMVKNDFITETTANDLKKLTLVLDYQALSDEEELARYFKQYIKKEFEIWSLQSGKPDGGKYDLNKDGLKVYTSLDYDMQIAAEKIIQNHMKKLQRLFEESWKGGKMYGSSSKLLDEYILSDPLYKSLRKQGLSNKEALTKFTTPYDQTHWTWNGYETNKQTKIDSIKNLLRLLHAGLLAAEPNTGKIKVWVGGNDYGRFQWDNILSPRQVGSIFKPIVYLAALESGVDPCDYFPNELRNYQNYQDWTPKNADGVYGGYLSVWEALAQSVNTISVQLLFQAGIKAVVAKARSLGIQSTLNEVPSIVLGTSDISLFEMVQAYSHFAQNGKEVQLSGIKKIEDNQGNVLYERAYDTEAMPQEQNESLVQLNAMLTEATQSGTGSRLYDYFDVPPQLKGKTGTTQNQSDGWFIAYNESLVAGGWVGWQDRRMHFKNLGTGSGSRTALPLVGALFEYANNGKKRPYNPRSSTFECPNYLSDEDYARYQKRQSYRDEDGEDFIERLLKDLFGRPKRRNQNRSTYRKDWKKLEAEKQQRMKQYEMEKKEWEKRLKEWRRKNNRR